MTGDHAGSGPTGGDDPTGILRVLVVDDQALMRSGFSMMLSVEPDIEVIGDAADGADAVEMCRRLRPDVVLMDVQMPGTDGIEATRIITGERLAKVLILTTFDRDDYLFDALRAGASGFLLKNSDPEDLVDGVRAVGHGHALLAPEVTRRVIERLTAATPPAGHDPPPDPTRSRPPTLDLLTTRETEVLRLVARGLSNAEIARDLVVGEATVKTHVSSCLAKLHLRDRVQAVVLAYEAGLVNPGD
ncbi:response regulator transcription factor [Dietzia sp. PP-33]|jgi:DNA-binding NarL/FixJ family response regulator|uniref:response regulator transcription factor n=1 Tax=Dietzia sp. PP-33 TaxID=2957500 RepID=UPI0029B1F567|nr:response regulator transcription factor [Dietzia sp. PP-33]MDX2356448.1 response regulator transcription factor [Dietzia sp. PP-33]